MKDFPHLGDTAYPHLGNVDPYRRKVDFDYGRYDYTATIKLCNVAWPMDYRHCVNWHSAFARDAYLEGIDGPTIELASGFTHVQTDSVMVPVPYDVALTYNYVVMKVPPLTQDDHIDYETTDGVRTICAFVQGATYHSPSTTELTLQVDQWTTYLPHLATNPVLMLHRGHAPAYATDVDTYLANPRAHCQNLLTPDVSYGTADVASHSTLLPIGAGEKWLVLASTIPGNQIEGLTEATVVAGASTPATFYDTGARNGHQVGVNDYDWHYGGHGYSLMRNPSAYTGTGGAVPSYLTLYALPTSQASAALAAWASRLPQFVTSIQAAYILPRNVLGLAATPYTVCDVSLYRVTPNPALQTLADLELTRSDFGYPTRYAEIAKLYTSPYARLVISDTLGQSIEVRIEDMGANAQLKYQLSPMLECLRWDVLISGVGYAGANSYAWTNLAGNTQTMSLPGADVGRYTLELGIPTYALYLDGRIDYQMHDYYGTHTTRANAVNAYQSTMRSANNDLANTNASAATAKANADASADTAKTNADASADTNVTNVANNGSNATANTVIANNLRTSSTTRSNTASNNLTTEANQHLFNTLYADDEYTMSASDINLKSEAMAGALTTVGNLVSGNAFGAVASGMSSIVNITTSQALSALSSQNIEDKEAIGQSHQTNINAINVANASDQTTYQNTAATGTTANNVSTANTNASNSAATAKANATRSQTTAKANATRTQGTTNANAGHSRDTTEENAKAALELARQNYLRGGRAHDLDSPVRYGLESGDASPDALMRRVVQVRIDTQSAGAIARAGDAMLRYGYTFDGLWSVTDWCPEGHDGCYWEASDMTAQAAAFANPTAERTFEDILLAGVTIWNDPAKIGGVPW